MIRGAARRLWRVYLVVKDAGIWLGQRRAGWLGVGDRIRDVGVAGALGRQLHGGSVRRESSGCVDPEFGGEQAGEREVFGGAGEAGGVEGRVVVGQVGGAQAGEQAEGKIERADEDSGGKVERARGDSEVGD